MGKVPDILTQGLWQIHTMGTRNKNIKKTHPQGLATLCLLKINAGLEKTETPSHTYPQPNKHWAISNSSLLLGERQEYGETPPHPKPPQPLHCTPHSPPKTARQKTDPDLEHWRETFHRPAPTQSTKWQYRNMKPMVTIATIKPKPRSTDWIDSRLWQKGHAHFQA